MFSQVSVILFTRAGYVWQTPLWADTPWTDTHREFCSRGGGWQTLHRQPPHPAQCMLGYTHPLPNSCWDAHPLSSACWDAHPFPHQRPLQQTVRILLECILVLKCSFIQNQTSFLQLSPLIYTGDLIFTGNFSTFKY